MISSDYLQGCRNAHANASSSASSHNWPISGLRWVAAKECLHGGLNLFPVNDSMRGRSSRPEEAAEEVEEHLEDVSSVLLLPCFSLHWFDVPKRPTYYPTYNVCPQKMFYTYNRSFYSTCSLSLSPVHPPSTPIP